MGGSARNWPRFDQIKIRDFLSLDSAMGYAKANTSELCSEYTNIHRFVAFIHKFVVMTTEEFTLVGSATADLGTKSTFLV
jgi:hypothetical protein